MKNRDVKAEFQPHESALFMGLTWALISTMMFVLPEYFIEGSGSLLLTLSTTFFTTIMFTILSCYGHKVTMKVLHSLLIITEYNNKRKKDIAIPLEDIAIFNVKIEYKRRIQNNNTIEIMFIIKEKNGQEYQYEDYYSSSFDFKIKQLCNFSHYVPNFSYEIHSNDSEKKIILEKLMQNSK